MGLIAKAIQDIKYLPSAFLMVFDDDILWQLKFQDSIRENLGFALAYLLKEIDRMITS